ncbi:hypothetical protein ACQJBY_017737 [Aegilops geniculata]
MIRHRTSLASPITVHPLDDKYLLEEILLRLPPQPSSLPRASLVCTRWRNIILDPDFLRCFRRHHKKPPLLGFFAGYYGSCAVFIPFLDAPDRIPCTRFPLQQNRRYDHLNVHGCHHGLVVLLDLYNREAMVWDPLTGHDHPVPFPPGFRSHTIGFVKTAVVLCAATEDGHVHGDCSLSPFKVAFVGNDVDYMHAICSLYESQSGVCGNMISLANTGEICDDPGLIVGNSVYWLLNEGGILELDMGRQSLGVIEMPTNVHFTGPHFFQIIWTKDSCLGLAILSKTNMRMQLWERKSKNDGVVRWGLQKTVQLDQLLPPVSPKERKRMCIIGYDSVSNTIVLWTTMGASVIQLETLELRNIPMREGGTYYPYTNFYTAGIQEASRSQKGELCLRKGCEQHDPELYFE